MEKRITITVTEIDSQALDSLTHYQKTSQTEATRRALRRDLITAEAIKRGDTPAFIRPDGSIRELVIVDFEHLRPKSEEKGK